LTLNHTHAACSVVSFFACPPQLYAIAKLLFSCFVVVDEELSNAVTLHCRENIATMNKFLTLILAVLAIAQASAFMSYTPVLKAPSMVSNVCSLCEEKPIAQRSDVLFVSFESN
jgi:hypothetical protein